MALTDLYKVGAFGTVTAIAEPLLMQMHTGGLGMIAGIAAGAIAYKLVEDGQAGGQAMPSLPASTTAKLQNIGSRLLNGKSSREEWLQPEPQRELEEQRTRKLSDTELVAWNEELTPPDTGRFDFSHVLANFTPALDRIFLARTQDGMMIYCTVKDLCHVALAGATGGGKSSIMRMIMCQLCKIRASVLLLNPHYTDYDLDSGEDWTPFKPYLADDPMECRKYERIAYYLKKVATELLPKRLERYAHSQPVGKPYFLVIDELPAIVANIPDAPRYLATILREGRKVGVFLVTAAQDFLVKTIAPPGGGAIRECYRTAFYVGGDATTATILLDIPARQIEEEALGKGVVMLRNLNIKKALMVHVPYVDNEALYKLLGPSTYAPVAQDDPSFLDLWQELTGEIVAAEEVVSPVVERMAVIPTTPAPVMPVTPIIPAKQRTADEIDIAMAIQLWNGGFNTKRKLMTCLDMKDNQVLKLIARIKEQAGAIPEGVEE